MSATNRGTVRIKNDFYPTPEYTIDSLLETMKLKKINTFLEPCAGDFAIYKKFEDYCNSMEWCEISKGKDYLKTYFPTKDLIVTNPPFSLAEEFLTKSLSESEADCVVYLLRLNYMGSKKRLDFWKENPPKKIIVLSKRPSFSGKGTDATEYAWFCWGNIEKYFKNTDPFEFV